VSLYEQFIALPCASHAELWVLVRNSMQLFMISLALGCR
jgi:hypothetical protein